jgi:hypothetical protein
VIKGRIDRVALDGGGECPKVPKRTAQPFGDADRHLERFSA